MENQKLTDLTSETRVDISSNLLETSHFEPDLDQTDEDFQQQNEIINQELKKYDKRLNTCSMCLFKFWICFYMTLISGEVFIQIQSLLFLLDMKSTFYLMVRIFMALNILVAFVLFYGCILFWGALHSKDPFKIERMILIFKIWLISGVAFLFADIALNLFEHYFEWDQTIGKRLVLLVFAAINYAVGLYVKRVLLKRDVFQQVSSYQ